MPDSDPVNLSMGAARRTANAVRAWERTANVERGRNRRWPIPEDGGTGGCDAQNCKIQIIVLGVITSGSFDLLLTVNGTLDTLTINWDDTTSDIATTLATHPEIASSDIAVTGSTLPTGTVQIEFIGTLAATPIDLPLANWTLLDPAAAGRGVITQYAQLGHAA